MSRANPKRPPEHDESPERELVTASNVKVVVNNRPPRPAPTWKAPEPPAPRGPEVVIVPESQAEFIKKLDDKWGWIIDRELVRYKEVAVASRPDVRQNVLVFLCRHYTEQKEQNQPVVPEHVPAFLCEAVHFEARNHGRKKGRRIQIEPEAEVDEAPDAAMDPEQTAEQTELLKKIKDHLDELTPDERQVFEARAVDRMTFEMIAVVLDRPHSTVFDLYNRALRKLRDLVAASERGAHLGRGRGARVDFQK